MEKSCKVVEQITNKKPDSIKFHVTFCDETGRAIQEIEFTQVADEVLDLEDLWEATVLKQFEDLREELFLTRLLLLDNVNQLTFQDLKNLFPKYKDTDIVRYFFKGTGRKIEI